MAESLFVRVSRTPAVQSLRRRLENGGALSCPGIAASAQPFLAALLKELFPQRPVLAITPNLKAQEIFQPDVETWLKTSAKTKSIPALFYPSWEVLPHEARLPHADIISERLQTLVALSVPGAAPPLIVASAVALLQRTFMPADLRIRTRRLRQGEQIDPLDLIEWLEAQGYEPEAQVTQKGEIALRGGIVDVFPLSSPWPVRLEFFGTELESLRYFDPLTQISRETIAEIVLPPAGELGFLRQDRNSITAHEPPGAAAFATLLEYLPAETVILMCEPPALEESANDYSRQVPAGHPLFLDWDEWRDEAQAKGMTLIEVSEAEAEFPGISAEPAARPSPVEKPDEIGGHDLERRPPARQSAVQLNSENAGPEAGAPSPRFESLDSFRPVAERAPDPQIAEAQRREFFAQLHRWLRQGYAVHVFCNNDGERQRFTEIWSEYGFGAPAGSTTRNPQPTTNLGALARGFLFDEGKLAVVTDAEIFGRYKVQRPRRLKSPHAPTMRSALEINFGELEIGDFVVHLQHGIGRYLGLQLLPPSAGTRGGKEDTGGQECLVIEYATSDPAQSPPKLYVPVTEAHLVGKYVGAGKAQPQLNTLGGTRWTRTKEQAERAVKDLAGELLAIQAARDSQAGHAFGADAPWQREFESAFIYEETPDQLRAIDQTKNDMQGPRPMDRLICGDVGFGKTEVAIRAAFKAVMGGKQVAILVPTTVLAQQHFNTFRERMADYPIRVELLSRFRTRREQQRVIQEVAAGAVDIVIGTHRLVQADLSFKDLGLVVIDEEQRFGVMQKERFKQLRRLVDVLTLSATPIPRTLYLALTGARDMSTIETPPQDRLPVETIATQYDERVIRDAIQREMNRGGQVFFLHNRVTTIDLMAQRLRDLIPHARILVGHGQMHSDDLEEVMTQFVNGEADVLLSTTIIESGLDIPNANTIIIDRADRFGLSELYQLRGRVGRYKHQAYAYLLIPRHGTLLTDARKRISAIKQYSTLGSGFKIAMRDLEIRGAGNLLGPEQSGHITAVGFELYCQLLQQSVSVLKGEKPRSRVDVTVRLDFISLDAESADRPERAPDKRRQLATEWEAERARAPRTASAGLPMSYVAEAQHRIDLYRKLAQAMDKAAVQALRTEIRDRFGPLPAPVELLLQIAELKILASERKVHSLETREDKLMLMRHHDYLMVGDKFPRLTKPEPKARLNEIRKLLLAL